MPLSMMRTNEESVITELRGTPELKKRLNELGLVKGNRVRVIQGSKKGSIIIKVLDSKLVLNVSVAHNIMVA
ncbi:MAG: FeoA family protein [Proteocatella sp.]